MLQADNVTHLNKLCILGESFTPIPFTRNSTCDTFAPRYNAVAVQHSPVSKVESGQTLVEYGLIIVVVGIGALLLLSTFGVGVNDLIGHVRTAFDGAASRSAP